MEERFRSIYRNWFWGDPESISGPGSSLEQTARIRERLPEIIRRFGVSSLLDIPCGDLNWMRGVDLGVRSYIGADIVDELVEENRRRYGSPGRTFLKLDVTSDPLPRADLVLIRDCLVHFCFDDIFQALANLKQSGCRLLLTTTFPDRDANTDIETGNWRPLNLQKEPFLLPEPILLLNEGCPEPEYRDKSLGLWRMADVP